MSRATTVLNHIQITYPTQSMVEETRLAARVLISFNRHFIDRLEEEGCLQKSHAHKMIHILNSRDRELQRSRMSLSLAHACSERDSRLAKVAESYVRHLVSSLFLFFLYNCFFLSSDGACPVQSAQFGREDRSRHCYSACISPLSSSQKEGPAGSTPGEAEATGEGI